MNKQEVGRNPELMYPIKLGGTLCSAPVLEACVEGEVDAADACCTELFDEDSDAAEELISNLMAIAFAGIIPGEYRTSMPPKTNATQHRIIGVLGGAKNGAKVGGSAGDGVAAQSCLPHAACDR